MKTHVECLPCLLRQALQVARISNCSKAQQMQVLQEVASIIADLDVTKSPPANAGPIYSRIAIITGCEDPYKEEKNRCNDQALAIVTGLRQEIQNKEHELLSAVRYAIAGNIIDYGAFASFDIDSALQRCRTSALAVDHFQQLAQAISRLRAGSKVLYLTDNCGEIVYDSLLIEYLYKRDLDITIAVKAGPIINDALIEDACAAGLDRYGRIITNGTRFPGTIPEECSSQFLGIYNDAELVISKGQGNFESLSGEERDIFFLLTIKCAVAAQHMAELTGVAEGVLTGQGEMAVYYSLFGENKIS